MKLPTYTYPAVSPQGLNIVQKNKQGLQQFIAEYRLIIPLRRIDEWRMVYPAHGTVKGQPHYGECILRATDGIHAYAELFWAPAPRPLIKISLTNWEGQIKPQGWTPKESFTAKQERKPREPRVARPRRTTLTTALQELLAELS